MSDHTVHVFRDCNGAPEQVIGTLRTLDGKTYNVVGIDYSSGRPKYLTDQITTGTSPKRVVILDRYVDEYRPISENSQSQSAI